ncbi:opsin-1, short-wave-sensitive 2-like [Myxocyprinus asiaticus]|uniref:opsin-1, short-wave-sensitive 2-like n=1 Tax=Myxocyprinus asiaticus TaxID=70543 RepID=UPI002222D0AF|nr:opsin-1, short-wave-sensitive 2-like [Myxocyprinus asiaticus]
MRKSEPEFQDDFYIPIPLETNNVSALSPYLVPQDHLGHHGVFMAMAAFMFFLFIAGTAINILTIVCTIKFKKLRSHLNYILVNLAVSNLIVSFFGSSVAFYCFWEKYFILGLLGCKIEGFTSTIGGMVSLWSLAVVAFERWLVICKPLGNFTFKTTHAIIGCILPWIIALSAAIPPLCGWSRYIPEGLQCSCGPDWYTTGNKYNNESFVMFLFCFCFAVPFSTIVFCYGQLLITLKSAAKAQADSASTQKAEKEVTKMVVVMVFGFLLCWGPYACFALWMISHRGETFDLRLATIPSCLCKASTVYNPVIYVMMNKQFRSCMMKMVCGKNIEDDESSASSQVTQVSSVAPEK